MEKHESPDERRARRRARRWKRRARIIGPFLGIPVLLGALALSVDLIEYQPAVEPDRLTDRPIPAAVLEKQKQAAKKRATSVSSASVMTAQPLVTSPTPGLDEDTLALEIAQPKPPMQPPTPPSSLVGDRR